MDLEMLKGFVAIVEAGSFTAAAQVTGKPKSTLSRHLQEFEQSLDLRLIERSTRSLRLTSDGSLLYERARHLISEANEIEHLLKDRDKTPKGHMRLAVPILFGQLYLGKLAGMYAKRWPDTTLDVQFADRQADLIEEDFDCAIRVGPLQDSTLIAQVIAQTHHVAVAAPSLKTNVIKHPDELSQWPAVHFSYNGETRPWSMNNDIESIEILPPCNIQMANMYAVRDACREGGGIAWLPSFFVDSDIQSGRLVPVLSDWKGPNVEIRLVYPSRRNLSARVKAFRDLLTEYFADRTFPPID